MSVMIREESPGDNSYLEYLKLGPISLDEVIGLGVNSLILSRCWS